MRPKPQPPANHIKTCKCPACDEYNYDLIFWEKEFYENQLDKETDENSNQ